VKTFQNRRKSQSGFARVLQAALLVAAACSTAVTLLASPPSWWSNGVVDPQAAADDYAAVNQGQLKNIAKQASLELDARLPGGAGTNVLSFVQGWSTPGTNTDDFAPVNLGQLKNVAKPFYDRLMEFGVITNYPWVGGTNAPNDFALANIGQVKNLFSFDLGALTGQLPEWWQRYYFNGQTGIDPEADADGDGLSNLEEYSAGLNPALSLDSDNNGLPDDWEMRYFAALGQDPNADPDGDGVKNKYEVMLGTSPWTAQPGPANFQMVQNADRSCDFTWEDQSGGAHGHIILRTNDDGTEDVLGVAPAGATTFHWKNEDPK
jgi:hypothetical protein